MPILFQCPTGKTAASVIYAENELAALPLWVCPCRLTREILDSDGIQPHKAETATKKATQIFFFFFCLFRAAPLAYGGSQARGPVGAVASGLYQSHSNARS